MITTMKEAVFSRKFALISIFISVAVLFSFNLASNGKKEVTADNIVRKLQSKYNNLKGFRADFTQSLLSTSSSSRISESGKLIIKKGGKMKWKYTDPEEKLFVCDGSSCYMYLVEENLVQRFSLEQLDTRSAPMLFFSGRGVLERDFVIELIPYKFSMFDYEKDSFCTLKLKPKGESERFDHILALVNLRTYLIERMVVVDLMGNKTDYNFKSIEELDTVAESEFKFKIPQDAEIVEVGE